MQPSKTNDNATPRLQPFQFSVWSLLFFVSFSAVILALSKSLGFSTGVAIFGIVFYALMMIVLGLMTPSRKSPVTVYRTDDDTDARLCRNYLREHRVVAEVIGGLSSAFSGIRWSYTRVVVPAHQAELARRLLEEHPVLGSGVEEEERSG